MDPVTRLALRRAWGMCPRHSFAYLSVDAAFRRGFLHGPAILYEDLMDRGTAALRARGPLSGRPLARSLRTAGPCHMCSMGYGPASRGWTTGDILERGRDLGEIRVFTLATETGWRPDVCGRCSGDGSPARCRPHLLEDLRAGQQVADLARTWVARVHARVRRYARSFRWELRGTDTLEDRAALISAAGWCSGWGPWLELSWATGFRSPSSSRTCG